eukprot:2667553-Ditylum_brightwellii.AAC.1
MDETRLLCKFVTAWHVHPRPVGCPHTTICHTYLHMLWFAGILVETDTVRKFSDWTLKIMEYPKKRKPSKGASHPISL